MTSMLAFLVLFSLKAQMFSSVSPSTLALENNLLATNPTRLVTTDIGVNPPVSCEIKRDLSM